MPHSAEAKITLDLHGKNQYQARIAIEAALRRSKDVYRIHVIHGYHRGTALRDMIREEYANDPRILRLQADGDSATDLILKEL